MILLLYYCLWILLGLIPKYLGIESDWNKSQKLFGISATILTITGLIIAPVIFIFTVPFFSCKWYQLAGFILMFGGMILNVLARIDLDEWFTIKLCIQPGQRLIKSGVYKYMKHPGYIGMAAFTIGATWMLDSPIMAMASIFYCVMLIYRIKIENEMLKELENGRVEESKPS